MSRPFIALARKEARALLPVWAASLIPIVADPLIRQTGWHSLFPLGMFAYIVGSLALGAHAIGHEYTNRTLATLLVQPWKRSSLLLTKAAVLAVMLLTITLVARAVLFPSLEHTFDRLPAYPTLILPAIGGLFVAPYVTMALRSQMAGIVFTAAIPGTVYVAALLVGMSIYGLAGDSADRLALAVWQPAMAVFAAAGAVLSVRSFMRLQAIDGGREELRLPRWFVMEDRTPIRPPMWMLVKKELRLQQMTFAMAALYGGIWLALTVAGRLNPQFIKGFPIRAVGVLYFALLPLLMGSLASAQEREFGTFESQAMLPISFARQWAVKAGVVLVLALILGVVVPWFVFAPPELSRGAVWPLAGGIVVLTVWSLYLSSWSRSGIIALALILPATAAALVTARSIDWLVTSTMKPGHVLVMTRPAVLYGVFTIVGAPLAVLLLWFAARNHRTAERTVRTLAVQAACLAGLFLVTDALAIVL